MRVCNSICEAHQAHIMTVATSPCISLHRHLFVSVTRKFLTTMSRASFALLLVCIVCVTELSCGYIIRGRNIDSVLTKEVPASQDLIDGNKLTLDQEVLAPEIPLNRKCKAIGEFCINHKDCCSNACLGYLKKCVS